MAYELSLDGYRVQLAASAEHARVLARSQQPALAVLGAFEEPRTPLMLLEQIRAPDCASAPGPWESTLPVIVLGRAGEELALLRAFDAGADDFVAADASQLEIRARVGALLRRVALQRRPPGRLLRVRALSIDTSACSACMSTHPLGLRRMEFELLVHLAREPSRVCSRAELLGEVWGYRATARTRTVDSHASRLRRKLDPRTSGAWVIAVRGVGYRLI